MRLALLILVPALFTGTAFAQFPDAHDPAPAGWSGKVFRLSQNYPKALVVEKDQPWLAFDPVKQPFEYGNALYRYVLEGNVETEWEGYTNHVRQWYHAPWMHFGPKGREFVRGMTRERTTPKAPLGSGELGPLQTSCSQNWAVSLFNPQAGFAIGRVWRDPMMPDEVSAVFPEGSVVVKLLFSAANEQEVPYLKNALEWDAHVNDIPPADIDCRSEATRKVQRLKLLQMDLAVKDRRVPVTGWVFATMVYDGNLPGTTWPERMVLLGTQWGNDPGLQDGYQPKESWISPNVKTPQHLGYQRRLNGPVDNPRSACMSCHATAQVPARSGMTPPSGSSPAEIARWFRNLPGDVAFDNRAISTDYSLQLAMGIQNFQIWKSQAGGFFAPPPPRTESNAIPQLTDVTQSLPGSTFLRLNGNLIKRIARE